MCVRVCVCGACMRAVLTYTSARLRTCVYACSTHLYVNTLGLCVSVRVCVCGACVWCMYVCSTHFHVSTLAYVRLCVKYSLVC